MEIIMKKHRFIQITFNLYKEIKHINEQIKQSALSAYSGQTAFFLMLSFFPFIMFLFSLMRFMPLTEEEVLNTFLLIIPQSFEGFFSNILIDIYEHQLNALLPFSVITTIWLGSKVFISLSQGLNSVYEIEENRSYIKIRFFSIIYTIVFAVMIMLTLAFIVFGNTLYFFLTKYFPVLDKILLPIIIMRPLISLFLLFVFFLVMYRFIPNRKCQARSQVFGAFMAASGWILFSYIYSFYIDHISNYSIIYGTMTIIAFLMLWLYFCMYIILLGGLMNHCYGK